MNAISSMGIFRSLLRGVSRKDTREVSGALARFQALKSLSDEILDKTVSHAVEESRARKMSPAERDMQIVNYVWGNAPEGNQGTRSTVKENINRLVAA
jgi:hypothetical protein